MKHTQKTKHYSSVFHQFLFTSLLFQVQVTLKPKNEAAPQFTGAPYTISVAEDTSVGTVLTGTSIVATDADSADTGDGKIIIYADPPNNFFEVSANGDVTLASPLDYEALSSPFQIALNIYAQDLGQNPDSKKTQTTYTVTVTNVNDVYPVCTDYHIVVTVAGDPGTTSGTLATLSCSDTEEGATIGYALKTVNGNAAYSGTPTFAMTSNVLGFSGGAFDFATTEYYSIIIDVTDHATTALTSTVEVSVFVTETFDPVFSPSSYSFTVDENLPAGSPVGDVDASGEGTKTIYSLLETTEFTIDQTGQIYTNKAFDRETTTSVTFKVRAAWEEEMTTRFADLSLTVNINDVNDNIPLFNQASTTVQVTEGSSEVLSFTVSDADATAANNVVTVSIDPSYNGGSESTSFVYSSGGPSLTINANDGLDYDAGPRSYEIRLLGKDSATSKLTGTSTVYVEVLSKNEAQPTITSSATFAIDESELPGSTVGTVVATDADSDLTGDGMIRYSFTAASSVFSIGYASGIIKTKTVLDHETDPSYQVTVSATDLGSPASATTQLITINVNDVNDEQITCGSPASEHFHFSVTETTTATGTIGTITCNAVDDTGSFDTLTLVTTKTPNVAWLGAALSGSTITLSHSAAIDYETLSDHLYTLVLTVTDNSGTSPSSTVSLTVKVEIVNDNEVTPSFTNLAHTMSTPESSAIDFSVYDVDATDTDLGSFGTLLYAFTGGNGEGKFRIDENSGEVFVATQLDYETTQTYDLKISVTDGGGLSVTNSLIVNIDDVNDNSPICKPPVYAVKIPESQTANDGIFLTIVCTDEDTMDTPANLGYAIVSQSPSAKFEFDNVNTNQIQVQDPKTLDYETEITYSLEVHVTDSGNTHTTTVSVYIDVEPVNEFNPTFAPQTYTFSIQEDHLIGEFIGTVTATDADISYDGEVEYLITAGNTEGKFVIDSISGEISLMNKIDVDSYSPIVDPKVFTLTVEALDRSLSTRKASAPDATVTISVAGINDSPPVCDSFYEVDIAEDQTLPHNILDFSALCTDPDTSKRQDFSKK